MSDRSYNWLFELYPDSMKPDAFSILDSKRIPFFVSPLHDQDVYGPDDDSVINGDHAVGEVKKAHYHLVLMFETQQRYNRMLDLAKELALDKDHPVYPKVCINLRRSVRYLIHFDHPHKAQYSYDEILCFNGADPSGYFCDDDDFDDHLSITLMQFCEDNNILEYGHLDRFLRMHYDDKIDDVLFRDLYRWNKRHTMYVNGVLKSLRHTANDND